MRRRLSLFVVLMMLASALTGFAQTNFVVSDYSTFLQALSATTSITNFQANAQIVLSNSQTIEAPTNLVIDGGANNVSFSGSGTARIFHVRPKTTLHLVNVQIYNGRATVGGGVYNEGSLIVSNCVFGANIATNTSGAAGGSHNGNGSNGGSGNGAVGGAIFSKGPLTIFYSTFTNNAAQGGNGGSGGNGSAEFVFGGSGGNGGSGGGANGGAIYASGSSNFIFTSFFEGNTCACGVGGVGGSAASAQFPGPGGQGGVGGSGSGGAIFCGGTLRLSASFFQANGVTAGATAPAQGSGNDNPMNGGTGGTAEGGAVYLASSSSGSSISNCTLLANFCSGGLGGGITSGTSGDAGNGGAALGGGVASGAASAQIVYSTIATNILTGGASGSSGGPAGLTAGSQVYASPGGIKLIGSIISGGAHGSSINASGVSDGGFDLSSDSSGISQTTSEANRNPLLSVEVGVVTTNTVVSTNGVLVSSLTYPTTNFDLPVITNLNVVVSNLIRPTNLDVIDLTTNLPSLFVNEYTYNYDTISGYTYTNTAGGAQTNTTFSTNFIAGSNGGPTPTLSLSNGSPALDVVTGIPGISFPLLDQRLYYRVSPTALGALDPNGVSALVVTNGASSNSYTLTIEIPPTSNSPPSLYNVSDVTNFTITGTNFIYTVDGVTTDTESTNVTTIVTNSVYKAGSTVQEFVTNFPPPIISGPNVIGLGQGAMFTASVGTNVEGLGFQWRLDGTNLVNNSYFSGTTTSNLVLKNITTKASGAYTVIAGTTLDYLQTSANFYVQVMDLPKLSITSPASNARLAARPVTVRGTVTEGSTVTNIVLWITNLNGGPVQGSTIAFSSPHATASWVASLTPSPGTNLLSAWTFDNNGYQSPTVTREFFFASPGQLQLLTDGAGTISGATDKSKLSVGETYTLSAHPGSKSIFANWSVVTNGNVEIAQDSSSTLHFVMQAETVVTASFIANVFLPGGAIYNGLFFPTDTNTGPQGIITGLTVSGAGAYSGKIFAWGSQSNKSFTGSFSPTNGFSSNVIVGVTNDLILTMTFTGASIDGEATTSNGTSQLHLDKMVKTNVTAAYTMLLLPFAENDVQGYGYALLTNRSGTTVISGTLADGTSFSQSVGVGVDEEIPFYVSLYTNGGFISGWIPPAGEIISNLVWIKPDTGTGIFPDGFSNYLSTSGAPWKTAPALSVPEGGAVTFTNGGLPADVTLDFTLTNGDRLYNTNNGNFGVINPNNGLITISVTNGDAGGITTAKGVALKMTNGSLIGGGGYFITSSNSGAFLLTPNP